MISNGNSIYSLASHINMVEGCWGELCVEGSLQAKIDFITVEAPFSLTLAFLHENPINHVALQALVDENIYIISRFNKANNANWSRSKALRIFFGGDGKSFELISIPKSVLSSDNSTSSSG
jgi:hypothetical protein